jgi:hypothetical protein
MKFIQIKSKTRKQLDKLFAGLGKDERTLIDDTLCGNSSLFKSKEEMIYYIFDACQDTDIFCPIQDQKVWNMRKWTKYNLMYYVAAIKYVLSKPSHVRPMVEKRLFG